MNYTRHAATLPAFTIPEAFNAAAQQAMGCWFGDIVFAGWEITAESRNRGLRQPMDPF